MTPIRLLNSMTRKKEALAPLDPGNVRMYVCGPTVYDRAHLGNARPVVVFDVLFRLLRHVYGEGAVTYVRNFTDVDDRINATALARKEAGAEGTLEELIHARSDETIRWYHEDMDALGALRPTHEPRATEYIPQMVAMIADLIAKGHAYEAEGHVLFAVDSWREGYGKLSGRSVEDMIAGARVEIAPYKRNPMDFVLWKPSDDELPGWDSPWGRGRPGWHIECSAMAHELLGESFDIHGGGSDLMFPHHENEIAQSCCAFPEASFAQVWLHNEMLMVEGKKMSKSLGNFFTVRDLLEKGVPGEVIRFVFLGTHYRKPMDWTEKKREEAFGHLSKYQTLQRKLLDVYSERSSQSGQVDREIVQALKNDLNTPLALTRLHKLAAEAMSPRVFGVEAAADFLASLQFLGFGDLDVQSQKSDKAIKAAIETVLNVDGLVAEISDARKAKDFSKADAIRDRLVSAGIILQMTKEGIAWEQGPNFDPAKLESLK